MPSPIAEFGMRNADWKIDESHADFNPQSETYNPQSCDALS
jgi:hypothetical protein